MLEQIFANDKLLLGSLGVATVLLAFVLNLAGKLSENSTPYLVLNILGAGLAGWYAWQEKVIPLFILEVVWGLAAVIKMLSNYIQFGRIGERRRTR